MRKSCKAVGGGAAYRAGAEGCLALDGGQRLPPVWRWLPLGVGSIGAVGAQRRRMSTSAVALSIQRLWGKPGCVGFLPASPYLEPDAVASGLVSQPWAWCTISGDSGAVGVGVVRWWG